MIYLNDEPDGKFLYTETIKLYVLYLSSVRDGRVSALKKAHNYALTCLDKLPVSVYDIHPPENVAWSVLHNRLFL